MHLQIFNNNNYNNRLQNQLEINLQLFQVHTYNKITQIDN